MAFTQDYLELCCKYRRIYQNKRRIKGDWYANLATPEIQVYDGKSAADFTGPDWFYVPDLDDLFEFLDIQIRLTQEAEQPAKLIDLTYRPDQKWCIQVSLENGLVHRTVNGESPHEVLLNAIYALSAFVVKGTDPKRRGAPPS